MTRAARRFVDSLQDYTPEQLRSQIVNLELAVQRRDIIGQAKGILMGVHGFTAEQAFDLLVCWSQRYGGTVHDVAVKLVADLAAERGRAGGVSPRFPMR